MQKIKKNRKKKTSPPNKNTINTDDLFENLTIFYDFFIAISKPYFCHKSNKDQYLNSLKIYLTNLIQFLPLVYSRQNARLKINKSPYFFGLKKNDLKEREHFDNLLVLDIFCQNLFYFLIRKAYFKYKITRKLSIIKTETYKQW